jgi:O-antigen ligase
MNTVIILLAFFDVLPASKKIFFIVMTIGFISITAHFFMASIIGIYIDGTLILNSVYPNFGNIRFVNQFHVQLFFMFTALALWLPDIYHKYIIIIGGISFFMLLLGGARGAMMSLFLVMIIGCIFATKNKVLKKIIKNIIVMMLLGIFIYLAYLYYESTLAHVDYLLRAGSSGRFQMWLEALSSIVTNPLGIGSYQYATITSSNLFSHPHNSILQFTLEWGWVAGFSLCVLMLLLFIYIIKILLNESCVFRISIGCSLLVAMSYSLLSGVFVMPASQMTFVFLLALLLGWNTQDDKSYNTKQKSEVMGFVVREYKTNINFKPLFMMLSQVVVLIVSILYMAYAYKTYQNHSLVQDNKTFPISIGARMWLIGGIVDLEKDKP